ncbi:MAG: hypothetical protein QOJ90_1999, partial [Actinomycetota bacterium]|nr:hypothetical protein [Actinomycetota bacterium]
LLDRLPATRLALATGRIDVSKARAIVDATTPLSDADAQLVETRVLPRAPHQTCPRLRQSLRRAVQRTDPAAAQIRYERAVRERGVALVALDDGMAQVIATMPATDAMGFFTWVTAQADKATSPGDQRTLNQRRCDVLTDVAFRRLAAADLPTRKGRRPHLQVTVSASTLLGLDEGPGELAGYGPITADVVRRVSKDATWRRLLTDPESGAPLDYGRTTHDPPQVLADHVIARDQTCTGIGCRQPARRCDLDHTVRYPEGPTAAHNVTCRCKHCHRLKHETEWTVEQEPDGSQIWTSPTGHRYTRPAIPVLEPG